MKDRLYYHKVDGKHAETNVPLFLLHTSPLDHKYLLNSLPKDYVPTNAFYFIDLSSHGKSPDIENKNLSFRKLADYVDQLRNDLGYDKVNIFGHGIGGFVAQYYATYHSKRTASLIISNSSPNHNYREVMAWNIRDNYSKAVKQKLADYEGSTDEGSLKLKFKTSLTYHFSPPNEDRANELLDSISRFPNEAYVIISNYLIPIFDIRQYNQKLKIPVLIISGLNDVWPKSILEMYHTDLPNATYEEFETGHFPMIDDSDNFWTKIKIWLNQI